MSFRFGGLAPQRDPSCLYFAYSTHRRTTPSRTGPRPVPLGFVPYSSRTGPRPVPLWDRFVFPVGQVPDLSLFGFVPYSQ
jgi:hypothetical protein